VGSETIVKYLVEQRVEANKVNEPDRTPLIASCSNNNESIIKYLVEHGSVVNKTP